METNALVLTLFLLNFTEAIDVLFLITFNFIFIKFKISLIVCMFPYVMGVQVLEVA